MVILGVHLSVNDTWRDCVRPDTVRHEFHRQCAVKRWHCGIRNHRQRNRRAGQRLIHQNRRDAHNMAGLLFAHLRYHSLRGEKVTRNIRANHQFEVRLCIVGERLRDVDASCVSWQPHDNVLQQRLGDAQAHTT